MGFSRQEYWGGFPFILQGDVPDPGMEPQPPALQADSFLSEILEKNDQIIEIKIEIQRNKK